MVIYVKIRTLHDAVMKGESSLELGLVGSSLAPQPEEMLLEAWSMEQELQRWEMSSTTMRGLRR